MEINENQRLLLLCKTVIHELLEHGDFWSDEGDDNIVCSSCGTFIGIEHSSDCILEHAKQLQLRLNAHLFGKEKPPVLIKRVDDNGKLLAIFEA